MAEFVFEATTGCAMKHSLLLPKARVSSTEHCCSSSTKILYDRNKMFGSELFRNCSRKKHQL